MDTKEKCEVFSLQREILPYISQRLRNILQKTAAGDLTGIEEIRMRSCKPLILQGSRGELFIDPEGVPSHSCQNPITANPEDIQKTLELMSENSIYAYQDEIKNGYITLKGGHRVGIAGRVVLEGNSIKNIKDVSGLNIRLSRQVKGCAAKVIKYLLKGSENVRSTLIISPPQCGKTTLLRDIARILSDGVPALGFKGVKVGVVDERSEIAACYKGVPQNDLGMRTDVMDGCPKAAGMNLMLRAMSPRVIITDEIGNSGDKDAVMQVINAGVKIITTAHGFNISEMKTRKEVLELIEQRVFERYLVLSGSDGPGTLEEVADGIAMEVIYKRNRLKGDCNGS
ncbi:MAG: stage III sporulation protein AA [Clostridia bacterium]|nr:stage III sporulation protein AA [Clostridia bacterium]